MDDAQRQDHINKSLKYSIRDGACASAMIGSGESFFPAYAVFLMADNVQLGLLTALPLLLGSLVQLFSHRMLGLFRTRKRLVSVMAILQGAMYLPIILVFFSGKQRVTFLIVCACLYGIFGMILSPAWNSWMGDLVNEKERGNYFGRRSRITGSASFVSYLLAGYVLYLYYDGETSQYLGFVSIFLVAFFMRIFSYFFLTKKYEPAYEAAPGPGFSFREFVREARFRNYGRFVLYLSFMNFSVYLSAPFFTPYMLKDLHFDYMTFTVINSAAIIMKFMAMPVWGRMSDQFGTKKILGLTGFLMPVVPVLWVFSANIYYLIAIQLYAGFIWAGFELSSFNFVFDTTTPRNRATGIAYYNVLNGICIFAGSLAGGLMVRYNDLFWSKYIYVFIISGVLRYLGTLVFVPQLKEVRTVEAIPYSKLFFKVIRTMPTIGIIYSFIPFRTEKKKGKKRPAASTVTDVRLSGG